MKIKKKTCIFIVIDIILIITIILLSFFYFTRDKSPKLISPDESASINYNSDIWEITSSKLTNILSNKNNSISIITLLTEDGKNQTISEYSSDIKSSMLKVFTDVKITQDVSSNLANSDSKFWIYEFTKDSVTMKVAQYIIIKENKVYLLTYSNLLDKFDENIVSFQNSAKTLKIK